jgi:hypothetical protein
MAPAREEGPATLCSRFISLGIHLPPIPWRYRDGIFEPMKIDRRRFLGISLASATLGGCVNGAASARGARSPLSVAHLGGEIQHLVVLMMENRSYDQMLGGLPGRKYAGPPPDTTVSYESKGSVVDRHAGWNVADPTIHHEVVPPTPERVPEFDFTRLGVRVPAVAISPWIERGSVFGWNAENPEDRHTFDHTSVLATVGEMTGVWVDSARARRATPLSVTLNRMMPRTDASKLTFRRGAYHGTNDRLPTSAGTIGGVGKELCDRFRAEHRRDATPEAIADYYASLIGA